MHIGFGLTKIDVRARPSPLSSGRRLQNPHWLSVGGDGLVVRALRRPFRDGTTRCLFEPLDFLARMAALVPRPRTPLVRYKSLAVIGAADTICRDITENHSLSDEALYSTSAPKWLP